MNPDQQSNYWKPDPETETDVQPLVEGVNETDAPYVDDQQSEGNADMSSSDEVISWKASEYIQMERDTGWFVGVAVATAVLLAVAIFLMKAITFAVLIVVMAVALFVLAKRPPRTLKYTLSPKGLYIAGVLHHFAEYQAFGVVRDEGEYSIILIPTKRFSTDLTVYFPANLGEQIVDFLGTRLPLQELQLSVVDKLVRKLRL